MPTAPMGLHGVTAVNLPGTNRSRSTKRWAGGMMLVCFFALGPAGGVHGAAGPQDRRIAVLSNANPSGQPGAASGLSRMKDRRHVESLVDALKDGDPVIRSWAAGVLGGMGAPAVKPLIAALKDADRYVRGGAAIALGFIKDPRSVEPLIAALKDRDTTVRRNAAVALGQARDPRSVEPLIAALKDRDARVRKNAAGALEQIDDPRTVTALMTCWRESDFAAIAGASSFFIQRGQPDSEGTLIRALNAHGDAEMAVVFLNCGNPALRAAAVGWAEAHHRKLTPALVRSEGARWGSRR